jgi:hypothetical protein
LVAACSLATLPNAFRQCTISLLIIHSDIITGWVEKLSGPQLNYNILLLTTTGLKAENPTALIFFPQHPVASTGDLCPLHLLIGAIGSGCAINWRLTSVKGYGSLVIHLANNPDAMR